jgi:hypothetical protein
LGEEGAREKKEKQEHRRRRSAAAEGAQLQKERRRRRSAGEEGANEQKEQTRLTSFRILCKTEHNLRRTIPPRSNILGLKASSHIIRLITKATRQAKVANLQLAISIDEQISRLEVAVQDIGRMNVFQAAQDLVDEGLEMGIC